METNTRRLYRSNPTLSPFVQRVTIALGLIGCGSEGPSQQDAAAGPSPVAVPEAVPGATPRWSAGAQEAIAAGEYAPQPDGAGFVANNRRQGLRATFGAHGVAVARRDGSGELALVLRAWGRDGALIDVGAAAPEEGACASDGAVDAFGACLHRVDYARPGVTEWWENRAEGLEQGFTVTASPEGDEPLVFDLAVAGGIAEVDADGTGARFSGEGGRDVTYAGLVATDEAGRELPAWLEETDGGLRIVVDDRGAVGDVTVDPLLTIPTWTAESNQTTAYFGYDVASAGDVNGDGYGDVVVGAYNYDNGEVDEGRVFVYLGSATGLSTIAAWTAESNQAGAAFGLWVSSAGDVNGDGYGDLAVGAYLFDNGESNEGRAFVYLGSATGLAASAAWTAESNQANAYFGIAIASAGDVNGDGFGDVIVGAHRYDGPEVDEGKAYLYLGSATGLAATPAWTAEANQAGAYFGHSVATAGDVNGDGYGDVIIGAYCYDAGQVDEGRTFLYFGSATGLAATPAWTAESNQASGYFGVMVQAADDVNGDGYGDVVIGAYGYDNGEVDEGRAYVYLGSSAGLGATPAWTGESNQVNTYYGHSVGSAGDVNGDGYADVIVGARGYDAGEVDEGRAFVYLGSATGLATTAAWTAEPNQANAAFGRAVASAGDVNGDGFGDLLVGAYGYDNGEVDEGAAFVYLGSPSGPATTASWTAEPDKASAYFGYSLASAGDVNGDGYADVIVGAYNETVIGPPQGGRVYLFLGTATGLSTTASWTAASDQGAASFGVAVASAGDVNGDGYGDVAIGASRYDAPEVDEGRVYVYLGSASGLSGTALWTAESNQSAALFGYSVASAGDVNGDGYSDLVVGAYQFGNGQVNEGRAFLYLGSATGLASSAAWTAESNQASASFGISVAGGGDVNADGYDDVLVGANRYNNGQADEGQAYLFLGSASGLAATPSWTADSNQVGAYFGQAVASAGDVNGDGYGDVIVGAYGYDAGQTDEGRAFVYLGSSTGLAPTSAWTAESDQASANFAVSVASAGDVNGDGYGDVVVGASGYDNGQADEGRAFVYLGSGAGLSIASAWSAESDQADAAFGYAVASAGDVNGDGYGDLIVGAHTYDNGSADEGRAFFYFGNGGDGTTPVSRVAQARQVGTSTPVAPGLTSTSGSAFDVALARVRGPWGSSRVKLQVETRPLGTPFDGTGLLSSPVFVPSGLEGTPLTRSVTGLSAATGYHWRARARVAPYEGRVQGWGPWAYGGASGNAQGGHVFTAGPMLYADKDGDGFGDPASAAPRRGAPAGFVAVGTDCDDTKTGVNPGATEIVADGLDQDCDGVDSCYTDGDGDNYGTNVVIDGSSLSCDTGTGAPVATDCDDANPAIHPGGVEVVADGLDQDCDDVDSCYTDADGDNYGIAVVIDGSSLDCDTGTGSPVATDCDDGAALVYPGAVEIVADSVDQDCDNFDSCYTDADGDNYGTDVVIDGTSLDCDTGAGAPVPTDCDDAVATVHPDAMEVAGDGVDQDCDQVDLCYMDADSDNYGTTETLVGSSLDCASGGAASEPTDCNDNDPRYHPGALETDCADPNDYNCDHSVGYSDQDGDGSAACKDCNDADDTIFPGAEEECNGKDDDCNDLVDDDPVDGSTWYADDDGDGYTDASDSVTACDAPEGYATASSTADCDDANAALHPGAEDVPDDGVDQDCDGEDALADDSLGDDTAIVEDHKCGCASGSSGAGWLAVGALALIRSRRRR